MGKKKKRNAFIFIVIYEHYLPKAGAYDLAVEKVFRDVDDANNYLRQRTVFKHDNCYIVAHEVE